jgi:hypothetical protein
MSNDAKFIPGLFFKHPHENAPDFIISKGSVKVADMLAWLSKQADEWVNFDLKESREGKLYASVDDWKPSQGGGNRGEAPARERPTRETNAADDFADDDIPF